MKTKLFLGLAAAAIVAVAALTLSLSSTSQSNPVFLDNVEALSLTEGTR